ncbi:MAG: hypothetical protein JWR00_2714, partial [Rubritepida sp.]|nr:hypothetical protein [Rubritepida sp.]
MMVAMSKVAPEPMAAPNSADRIVAPSISLPLWLLVLITTSGTFGIHVFVPALPQAAA